ncbi:Trk system potassium transporter TrkA [Bacillota bacterium]
MKIIIVGDGKVGHSLAERLSAEGNDVTIIDKNPDVLKKDIQSLDVQCIRGNGVSTKTLGEAGVSRADILIAVTSSDEVNMVCCLTAKKLGSPHTVARIRDPEYANELTVLKDELELDLIINPEQAAAYEMARIFSFSGASSVEGFYKGKINLVGFRVSGEKLGGLTTVAELYAKYGHGFIICAVERDGSIIIPEDDFALNGNDIIYMTGSANYQNKLNNILGVHVHKIKNIMIIGGGRVAYYLAKAIEDMNYKIKIIEEDEDRCLELNEILPDILIINGDGTDETLLESENLKDMDAFVAVTGWDEDNLMTALYAKSCGVPTVITKITRIGYSSVMKELGIDAFINPRQLITNQIMRYVGGLKRSNTGDVETIYSVIGGKAKAGIYRINKDMTCINKPLWNMQKKEGMRIAAIIRHNDILFPTYDGVLLPGDKVVVITNKPEFEDIDTLLGGGK